MYGVLGEDRSDAETLKVLIRRVAGNPGLTIRTKGYNGCHELKRKGAMQLQAFAKAGCTRFVVCHDADGPNPAVKRDQVVASVTKPSGLEGCCIVVPVQEIEAWILGDIGAVTKIFTSWHPAPVKQPERIASPKEYLERLSREGVARPRYVHAVHNPRVAAHLDVERVRAACPSFGILYSFVRSA